MSSDKKRIRQQFRDSCFLRDKYSCVMCGFKSSPEKAISDLDCHHIKNRNELDNGGYCTANGISLCATCHEKAEELHSTGISHEGFSENDLYNAIGSSLEKAIKDSKKLK